jgi:hypothetical protein
MTKPPRDDSVGRGGGVAEATWHHGAALQGLHLLLHSAPKVVAPGDCVTRAFEEIVPDDVTEN